MTDLKKLGTKETAARIRADIKNLQKHGGLPAGKFSVTLSRFAGGSSITVRVVDVAAVMFNVDRFIAEKREPHAYRYDEPRYTPEGERIMALLKKVVGVYHSDKSDIMSDYFNVNFYEHIESRDQEEKERALFDAAEAAAQVIDDEDEDECAEAIAERNAEIKAFAAERAAALAAFTSDFLISPVPAPIPTPAQLIAAVRVIRARVDAGLDADAEAEAACEVLDHDGVTEAMLAAAFAAA